MKIDKGIPIPPRRQTELTRAMKDMIPADSVFVPVETRKQEMSIRSTVHRTFGANNYAVRKQVENDVTGLRIWRKR